MNINSDIQLRIEAHIDEKLISSNSVGGGCIADSKIISSESGKKYFLKTYAGSPGMFLMEANGLSELSKPNAIRVPKVILADEQFLLLESIESGSKNNSFFKDFGKAFALMHKHTSEKYGFFENNYIGATPQINISEGNEAKSWPEFYFNKRLLQQLRFAEQHGYASPELVTGISKLENIIDNIIGESKESPTLLHGDLWGGNYMCDNKGNAVLIDPAVYYGHREADLAMTKMFGGFTQDFYNAYQKEYPLKENWQYREGIYLLYHYMNHLNLFGMGYYGQCIRLIQAYV